jgi:broad specificity phosphatase PhoE
MKIVYFMRHGQTDWNIGRRLQGRTDVPLNAEGLRQAARAAERFAAAGLRFDAVIASPLDRAVTTAMIAARVPREAVRLDPRLTEIGYGIYEGTLFSELEGDMLAFIRDPDHCPPPESVELIGALLDRAGSFLEDLRGMDAETVLAVTHGVAIRAILGCLSGEDRAMVWGMPVHNCQLLETRLENGVFSPARLWED